jgi:hypothetical protein
MPDRVPVVSPEDKAPIGDTQSQPRQVRKLEGHRGTVFVHNTESVPIGFDWAGRGTSHIDFNQDDVLPLVQGRFLGNGMYGGVYETVCRGMSFAWKRRYCQKRIGINELREIEVLKKLSHRHIIQLVGTYTQGPFLGLLLWPVAVCDLATFMEDVENFLPHDMTDSHYIVDPQSIIHRLSQLGLDTSKSLCVLPHSSD